MSFHCGTATFNQVWVTGGFGLVMWHVSTRKGAYNVFSAVLLVLCQELCAEHQCNANVVAGFATLWTESKTSSSAGAKTSVVQRFVRARLDLGHFCGAACNCEFEPICSFCRQVEAAVHEHSSVMECAVSFNFFCFRCQCLSCSPTHLCGYLYV